MPEILRLNEEARLLLAERLQEPTLANQFALVFLGDTHIGKQCRNDIDSSLMYTRLLQSFLHNQEVDKDILTIIHGGDGTHRGGQHLEQFAYLTRQGLRWDFPEEKHIPLFMNLGNHEYIHDPEGKQYQQFIGEVKPVEFYWLDELRWGIILLNTGMNNRGYLPGDEFNQALATIARELKTHRGYQVVIDMHIPPSVGRQAYRLLALNYGYTRKFKQLLRTYPKSIAAVISHHRHWAVMSPKPYRVWGRTSFYISAYGGHCDCPRFSGLKLTFQRQSGGEWKLSNQLLLA